MTCRFDDTARAISLKYGASMCTDGSGYLADLVGAALRNTHNAALDEAARQAVNFHESPTLIPKVIRDLKVRP